MNRIIIAVILLGLQSFGFARGGGGRSSGSRSSRSGSSKSSRPNSDVQVRSYAKKDGTYVQPHMKTAPNTTKYDNYSTKGNVNPYTGKTGTVDPEKPITPKP